MWETVTDQFRSEDLENIIESGTYGSGIRRAVVVVELFI
jgi:hypothetical protein